MTISTLLLCILPPLILVGVVIYMDRKHPEPVKEMLKALIYGILVALIIKGFLNFFDIHALAKGDWTTCIRQAFLRAALPEELLKLVFLRLLLRRNRNFDEYIDAVVYAVCIGMGFAIAENIMYAEKNSHLEIMRALLPVSGHYTFAILMGTFYAMSMWAGKKYKWLRAFIFIAPFTAHGLYDYICALAEAQSDQWERILDMGIFSFCLMLHFVCVSWLANIQKLDKDREDMESFTRFMKNKTMILLLPLMFLSALQVKADEGMWLLGNLDNRTYASMQKLGLKLTEKELYSTDSPSLKDCVVDFGGYCSGVIVSEEGLVMTNHHCAFRSIQALSTQENNLVQNGFVSQSKEQELPVEGLFVRRLIRTDDCTKRVRKKTNKKTKVDEICSLIENEYQKQYPGCDCVVKAFYGGNRYMVSVYKVYSDVRLVFAIPSVLGRYGGDTDNWMWPRQTCDFAIFRIYENNAPLHTPEYARLSTSDYSPGTYTMTIGYPGSTSRYLSSYGIEERINCHNKPMIDIRGIQRSIWSKWMSRDSVISLKYASKYSSSMNYWKNSIGMNQTLKDNHILEEKQQREQLFRNWYSQDKTRQKRYGHVLENLDSAYRQRRDIIRATNYLVEVFYRAIELKKPANILATLPFDADSACQEKARIELIKELRNYDARLDEDCMAELLDTFRMRVPAQYWPDIYTTINRKFSGNSHAYAHQLFQTAICLDTTGVDSVIHNNRIVDSNLDMLYAQSIPSKLLELYSEASDLKKIVRNNECLLTEGLMEMDGDVPHYSDANFTMRVSYGFVDGYADKPYCTTAESLLEKVRLSQNVPDYQLPDNLTTLFQNNDTLCFVTNNDITGGNSGSPIFNGEGKLMGLAFDGNWEAMSSDLRYDTALQRCIGVDIRYILMLIKRWGKNEKLLKEIEKLKNNHLEPSETI